VGPGGEGAATSAGSVDEAGVEREVEVEVNVEVEGEVEVKGEGDDGCSVIDSCSAAGLAAHCNMGRGRWGAGELAELGGSSRGKSRARVRCWRCWLQTGWLD
jgi:hypothetical protein